MSQSTSNNNGTGAPGSLQDLDDGMLALLQRNFEHQAEANKFNEVEARKKLFKASRTGDLTLMQSTLAMFEANKDAERSK